MSAATAAPFLRSRGQRTGRRRSSVKSSVFAAVAGSNNKARLRRRQQGLGIGGEYLSAPGSALRKAAKSIGFGAMTALPRSGAVQVKKGASDHRLARADLRPVSLACVTGLRYKAGMRKPGPGGLVYSTDAGRMCPACRQPLAACICAAQAPPPSGDGIVRVSREKQGRGGKVVTVVRGLDLPAAALAALGKRVRTACGAGGTVKDGVLEVQGDHADRVVQLLQAAGRVVKRAGG